MRFFFLICICFCVQSLRSQDNAGYYPTVDAIITRTQDSLRTINDVSDFINKNFDSAELRCRAIFKWLIKNIELNADTVFYYGSQKNSRQIIEEAFNSRKTFPNGYAIVFDTLCKLSGVITQIIPGVVNGGSPNPPIDWISGIGTMTSSMHQRNAQTNIQSLGNIKRRVKTGVEGHLWNAVYINEKWHFVDVVWGAGYMDGKQFMAKINTFYFLAGGRDLVKTHHPADPIWQLVESPITLSQFCDKKFQYTSHEPKWNCHDSIDVWLKAEPISRTKATLSRLKANGLHNEYLQEYFMLLEDFVKEQYKLKFMSAIDHYNSAVNLLNDYLNYKNNKFKPVKPDAEIKPMLDVVESELTKSDSLYKQIPKEMDSPMQKSIDQNVKNNSFLWDKINEEKAFVSLYLSTPKAKRQAVLSKSKFEAPVSNR